MSFKKMLGPALMTLLIVVLFGSWSEQATIQAVAQEAPEAPLVFEGVSPQELDAVLESMQPGEELVDVSITSQRIVDRPLVAVATGRKLGTRGGPFFNGTRGPARGLLARGKCLLKRGVNRRRSRRANGGGLGWRFR